jgi:hypothetical protein
MEADSIKIYNERQKYNEWEFVYDMKKDKRLMGAAGAMPNQIQNPLNPNQPNQGGPGNSPGPAPNGFGPIPPAFGKPPTGGVNGVPFGGPPPIGTRPPQGPQLPQPIT